MWGFFLEKNSIKCLNCLDLFILSFARDRQLIFILRDWTNCSNWISAISLFGVLDKRSCEWNGLEGLIIVRLTHKHISSLSLTRNALPSYWRPKSWVWRKALSTHKMKKGKGTFLIFTTSPIWKGSGIPRTRKFNKEKDH